MFTPFYLHPAQSIYMATISSVRGQPGDSTLDTLDALCVLWSNTTTHKEDPPTTLSTPECHFVPLE